MLNHTMSPQRSSFQHKIVFFLWNIREASGRVFSSLTDSIFLRTDDRCLRSQIKYQLGFLPTNFSLEENRHLHKLQKI